MTTPSPGQVDRYRSGLADLRKRLDSHPLDDPLPLDMLLAGGELLHCQVDVDAQVWAGVTMAGILPAPVREALGAVAAGPTPATLSALDRAVGRALKSRVARDELGLRDELQEIQRRVDLYRAYQGDKTAALRAAAYAWCRHCFVSYGGNLARQFGMLVTAFEMLDIASSDGPAPVAARAPRRASARADLRTASWLYRLDKEASKPDIERAEGFVEAASEAEPGPTPEDVALLRGPGLVVVPSLDHLPGSSTTSSSPGRTAFTPRGEFEALARRRIPLVPVPDLAAAAAELRAEFPGAEVLIDAVLRDSVGAPAARIRPTLLLGDPGSGKTRLARRLGEVLGLPVTVYGSGGVSDAAFGGTSRQWSTGRASIPLQAIKRANRANPLVILDEVEKAATSDHNGRLVDVLLPMLERETAAGTMDPYLECPVDLSAVSYIATANGVTGIPGPLLSRMRVLRMPRPPRSAVLTLAARIVADIRAERDTDARWMPDLDPEELAMVVLHWNGRDLRKLRRLVETVLAGREDLTQRH